MNWTIRETGDIRVFEAAFGWYQEMPDFLQHLQRMRGKFGPDDKVEFVKSMAEGYNFRADINKKPVALVHAERLSDELAEGHLFCAPNTNVDILVAAVSFARLEILKTFNQGVCHVLRRHRTLAEIVKRAGFKDSGLRAWQGVYRGRPQEILYFVAGRH